MSRLEGKFLRHDSSISAPGPVPGGAGGDANTASGPRSWLIRFPRALPLAIFLVVLAVTIVSVFGIERSQRQSDAEQIEWVATAMESALERRASVAASYLRAGGALFSTIDEVDPALFNQFVAELRLDSDYRGAEGYGWAPVLSADEASGFESLIGRYRVGGQQIIPSLEEQPRDKLVPIQLLQPDTARNRSVIGFDMYSEGTRRAAMDAAERDARPTASGRIDLVYDERQPGFILYMPVYTGGGSQRRVKGFIYSPFNSQNFLASAAELVERETIGVELYDGDVTRANLLGTLAGGAADGARQVREVRVAGRDMTLVTVSAHGAALSSLSMITLLFGIAVASLLMLISRLLTKQAVEDQRSLAWFSEQNSIRNSLTRELNHRVKNTLANVLSIVALTRRRADDVEEFADGLDGRIRALSATHDLLTQSEWGTTPIAAVVNAELAPYAYDGSHSVRVEGPEVELAPNDALSLGLALHELATNASKYGALSTEDGQVSITWDLTPDKLARIRWAETGGPAVASDRKRGFGMDLIEKIVAHELRNPVDLRFEPDGVRCTLMVPVRERSDFQIRADKR